MQIASIELSTDSFTAAIALVAVIPHRHMAPLTILFGLCDGLASLTGPMLHIPILNSGLIASTVLIFWGALIIINIPVLRLLSSSIALAYTLPILLALDNLVVPDDDWMAAGFISSAMAVFGFVVGTVLFRSDVARRLDRRWLGIPLALAGLLLAAG